MKRFYLSNLSKSLKRKEIHIFDNVDCILSITNEEKEKIQKQQEGLDTTTKEITTLMKNREKELVLDENGLHVQKDFIQEN